MIITETGSIRGSLEVAKVEINGHVDGKITADAIIIGKNAVIKGDIFFRKLSGVVSIILSRLKLSNIGPIPFLNSTFWPRP